MTDREVNLVHADMLYVARFAEQFLEAVKRYKGDGSFASLNEEAAFNALCDVVDAPKSRPRYLLARLAAAREEQT